MKQNLKERVISSVWLCLISFFFILSFSFFNPKISHILIYLGAVLAFIYGVYGFLHGYKILLLPADQLDTFSIRCMAGLWFGILVTFIIILFKDFILILRNYSDPIFYAPIVLTAFIIGCVYLYRILLLPKIDYISLFPSLKQRVISALWFGLIGYLLVLSIFNSPTVALFVFLLTAYQGYTGGYRNLLLPRSSKGAIKSAMLGFIYSSYALLIVFCMFIASDLPFLSMNTFNIKDFIGVNMVVTFLIFPIVSILVCTIGIISSVLFYAIFRPKLK